jgi:hypothetical protein
VLIPFSLILVVSQSYRIMVRIPVRDSQKEIEAYKKIVNNKINY